MYIKRICLEIIASNYETINLEELDIPKEYVINIVHDEGKVWLYYWDVSLEYIKKEG